MKISLKILHLMKITITYNTYNEYYCKDMTPLMKNNKSLKALIKINYNIKI